jgi:NitT/TauT family transport system permease protein
MPTSPPPAPDSRAATGLRAIPRVFGLHAQPRGTARTLLIALPFVLAIALYLFASHQRHLENPGDKLLPAVTQMVDAVERMAFTEDSRSGTYLMARDTLASLARLAMGVSLAAAVGLWLGLNMGMFPGLREASLSFVTFVSMIPPLAILPILFITFGVDELAKVMLIFIGLFPVLTRDVFLAVRRIPREQVTKALTLGASHLSLTYRIVLPQVLPRLIEALRLSLGAAWLFLIAAEAIAATEGLGYRIFLVRRYLAMDVILPYVLWITLLGYLLDLALRLLLRKAYPWYVAGEKT